ncbi:MAG: hypothetical protein HY901_31070 [Deltaproteobacteria bacterium]|nr:hypothetical protein [Deltaproteobacteria bacterium]
MSARRIPDALLERLAADDLDAELRAHLEKTLAESELDRARLEELQRDSAAFLTAHPPGPLVARFEKREQGRRSWRTIKLLLIPGVAVATLGLVLFLSPGSPIDQQRIQLAVYSAQGPGAVVGPLQVASAGDAVRFVLSGRSMGYVAVFGRDPSGKVRIYAPAEGATARRYDPKSPLLPDIARLAPGSGREEIIGVFSPRPFEIGPVVEALGQAKDLRGLVPEGSLTAVVPLRKD